MKLEIESTAEIVAIDGVPCRKWSVLSIDGTPDLSGAAVFTRLLMLPTGIKRPRFSEDEVITEYAAAGTKQAAEKVLAKYGIVWK